MSRCPKLDYQSNSCFGNSSDKYICKITNQQMDVDSTIVKYTCNGSSDAYRECQYYKNTRW